MAYKNLCAWAQARFLILQPRHRPLWEIRLRKEHQERVTEKLVQALLEEKISRVIVMVGTGIKSKNRKGHGHLHIVNKQKEQEQRNGVMRNRKAS